MGSAFAHDCKNQLAARPTTSFEQNIGYQFIGSQYHEMVHDSLTNQHPVKGIPVQSRKPGQMQRGFSSSGSTSMLCCFRCAGTNLLGGSGSGSLPKECLMTISQVETERR